MPVVDAATNVVPVKNVLMYLIFIIYKRERERERGQARINKSEIKTAVYGMGVKLHTPTLLPLRKFLDLFAFHRHKLFVVHQGISDKTFVNFAGNKGTNTTNHCSADATQHKAAQAD